MQIQVVDTTGKSTGKLKLPDEIFAVKANPKLLAQAVRVYLANQRQGTAKVKKRGEVRGSGRKIWRQKGTGRARHGDRYAPIFVGGGIAHGPTGKQQYKLSLSKKMRRKALFAALTKKREEKQLIVIEGLEKLKPKTKLMNEVLKKLTSESSGRISIILSENSDSVIRGVRNIQKVKLLPARKLNAYQVLNDGTIILMKDAVRLIKQTFLAKGKGTAEPMKAPKKKPLGKKTTEARLKAKKSIKKIKKTKAAKSKTGK